MPEVAQAAFGKTLSEINNLVLQCLEEYEHLPPSPKIGQPIPALYNLGTLEPTQEWKDTYPAVREKVAELGLDLRKRGGNTASGRQEGHSEIGLIPPIGTIPEGPHSDNADFPNMDEENKSLFLIRHTQDTRHRGSHPAAHQGQ